MAKLNRFPRKMMSFKDFCMNSKLDFFGVGARVFHIRSVRLFLCNYLIHFYLYSIFNNVTKQLYTDIKVSGYQGIVKVCSCCPLDAPCSRSLQRVNPSVVGSGWFPALESNLSFSGKDHMDHQGGKPPEMIWGRILEIIQTQKETWMTLNSFILKTNGLYNCTI